MIAEFLDEAEVRRYVTALRGKLADRSLDDHAAAAAQALGRNGADPAKTLLDAIPASTPGEQMGTPFVSHDPTVSLLQTSLEDEARKAGVVGAKKHDGPFAHVIATIESILHPERFGPHDDHWVTGVGAAMLDRLAKGNHRFNPVPAEHTIADDARVVIVGDWGTGLPRALEVARLMGEEVADALAHGREAHVVHLGDVYYSGDPVEYERRVLAPGCWPVTPEQARAGVTSWALNGNHDMYSGGFGFFGTMLRDDERFARQRSPDGKGTSFFRLKTNHWDIAGLDTSWDPDVLSLGQKGVLQDPQASILQRWAAESDRRLMLLTHHQLVSAYDAGDLGAVLPAKLAPLLQARRIGAWLWGHEHRCMGFADTHGVPLMRCIGHGGVPIPASDRTRSLPAPGIWEETGTFDEHDGSWHRFGFAVLDFAGARVDVRYRDDGGTQTRAESF
jgi:hypothetical protein